MEQTCDVRCRRAAKSSALSQGSSSTQLSAALRRNPGKADARDRRHGGSGFVGVYSSDTLPPAITLQRPYSLIVNYDRSGMPGSHWVAMRVPAKGPAEYFDSYGLPPDRADAIVKVKTPFRDYLRASSETHTYVYNHRDLQALGTAVCGDYSVAFVRNGMPPNSGVGRGDAVDTVDAAAWRPMSQPPEALQRDEAARATQGVVRVRTNGPNK